MSLAQKMKLQELTNQVEELNAPRRDAITRQKELAAEKIKNDILSFFTSKGFDITGNIPKVTASYQGGLQTVIDFSELIENFFGSDGAVKFKYINKEFSIMYSVNRGKLPSMGSFSGDIEQKKIEFYENTLIPALKELGVSDLIGDFTVSSVIQSSNNQKQRKQYKNVDEVLDEMIC
ncbi:hypothetical protein CV016_04345 [Yersinia kristensenii]|uniref:hypothetical protein n=1 Tax=Yersinia TaxID=629 RepID=UPI000C224100|nr:MULTISPECIES: hypothetical protein [Yersinia]EKN4009667.1 hypothetical protein [Yersinia enterocolitica]EKN4788164.1 hypothetical protein [Yersinia enterocolitica]ELI8355708.1 hypothetical protein [Yersinia enterocolitica]PJG63854.1 hypothetical protein CV016_04345 [Yersinia kristensenii]UYJ97987.1 hypothetical protein N4W06_02650 [Yersinia enterocolitica]